MMAYDIFPHTATGEHPFFSCTDEMYTNQHGTICFNERYATWVMMNARYLWMQ